MPPKKKNTAAEIMRLRLLIEKHDRLYHQLDQPEIADAEYDALKKTLADLEGQDPDLFAQNGTGKVGAAPLVGFAKVRHSVPMLSLGNAFSDDDVRDFMYRINRSSTARKPRRLPSWPSRKSTACHAACGMRTAR